MCLSALSDGVCLSVFGSDRVERFPPLLPLPFLLSLEEERARSYGSSLSLSSLGVSEVVWPCACGGGDGVYFDGCGPPC